jgi:hypothetical protein
MTDHSKFLKLPTFIPHTEETDHAFDVPICITIRDRRRGINGEYFIGVQALIDSGPDGKYAYIHISQWIKGADIQPPDHWVFARIDYMDFPLVWKVDLVFEEPPSYAEFGAYVDGHRPQPPLAS